MFVTLLTSQFSMGWLNSDCPNILDMSVTLLTFQLESERLKSEE